MQKCFQIIGYSKKPTDEEAFRIFDQMDASKRGEVTFEDFSAFMLLTMRNLYLRPLRDYLVSEGFRLE